MRLSRQNREEGHPKRRGAVFSLLTVFVALACVVSASAATSDTKQPIASPSLELPDFGDSSGNLMTAKQEKRLGQAFMRFVHGTEKVLDDPLLTDYLHELGQRLTENTQQAGFNFDFFFIDSPVVNAFAGPAGHIGIHTGLLLTSETEDELAGVMAHEIAHVTQRHLFRTWENASDLSVPQAAILLAAIVLGTAVGGDAAAAAAIGGQAALIQQQINFTRTNEQEADRVGIGLLADAGFDPRGMPAFFERMGRANRTAATKLPEFLLTHPVSTSRVADSMARAESFPYQFTPDSLRYHLTRAALRVRGTESAAAAYNHFRTALEDGRYQRRAAAQYGMALALISAREYGRALTLLQELRRDHPDVTEFIVQEARVLEATGSSGAAISNLQRARGTAPANYPIAHELAEQLIRTGRYKEAYELLAVLLRDFGDRVSLYRMIAEAATRSGAAGAGHEYLAEYEYLRGNTAGAVTQLEIARRRTDLDFYENSRIDAKLDFYRRELKEEEKEKRNSRI